MEVPITDMFPFYYVPQFWLLVMCVLTVPPLTLVALRKLKRSGSLKFPAGGISTPVKVVLTGFLAFAVLLFAGYTLHMAGGLLQIGLDRVLTVYGVLGVSVGLIAIVVFSYVIVHMLNL